MNSLYYVCGKRSCIHFLLCKDTFDPRRRIIIFLEETWIKRIFLSIICTYTAYTIWSNIKVNFAQTHCLLCLQRFRSSRPWFGERGDFQTSSIESKHFVQNLYLLLQPPQDLKPSRTIRPPHTLYIFKTEYVQIFKKIVLKMAS